MRSKSATTVMELPRSTKKTEFARIRRSDNGWGVVHRAANIPAAGESSTRMAKKNRVLIVDDFDDARDLYAYFLQSNGFITFEADSGAAAIALIPTAKPDIIILDISMPGMDGWQVAQALKSNPDTVAIPIVVLTGSGFTGMAQAHDSECAAYLLKPCTPTSLRDVILSVLGCEDAGSEAAGEGEGEPKRDAG